MNVEGECTNDDEKSGKRRYSQYKEIEEDLQECIGNLVGKRMKYSSEAEIFSTKYSNGFQVSFVKQKEIGNNPFRTLESTRADIHNDLDLDVEEVDENKKKETVSESEPIINIPTPPNTPCFLMGGQHGESCSKSEINTPIRENKYRECTPLHIPNKSSIGGLLPLTPIKEEEEDVQPAGSHSNTTFYLPSPLQISQDRNMNSLSSQVDLDISTTDTHNKYWFNLTNIGQYIYICIYIYIYI